MKVKTLALSVLLVLAVLLVGWHPVLADDGRTAIQKAWDAQGLALRVSEGWLQLNRQPLLEYETNWFVGNSLMRLGRYGDAQPAFERAASSIITHAVNEAWREVYGEPFAPAEAHEYYSWRVVQQEWPLDKIGEHITANVLSKEAAVEWQLYNGVVGRVPVTFEVSRPLFLYTPMQLAIFSHHEPFFDPPVEIEITPISGVKDLPRARVVRVVVYLQSGVEYFTRVWVNNYPHNTVGYLEPYLFTAKDGGTWFHFLWWNYHWSQDVLRD